MRFFRQDAFSKAFSGGLRSRQVVRRLAVERAEPATLQERLFDRRLTDVQGRVIKELLT